MEVDSTRQSAVTWAKKILICTVSIMLLGIASAFIIRAALGADPISVFYDGLSRRIGFPVGWTANIVNITLAAIVFIIDRKYIHIGTVIYAVLLGRFIDLGVILYDLMHIPDNFMLKFLIAMLANLVAFIGLGGYISVNIGVDPWTAIALIVSKKMKKSFRMVRIATDVLTLGFGWLMSGTVGIVTVICAVIGGPAIQKSAEIIDKVLPKMIKSKQEE